MNFFLRVSKGIALTQLNLALITDIVNIGSLKAGENSPVSITLDKLAGFMVVEEDLLGQQVIPVLKNRCVAANSIRYDRDGFPTLNKCSGLGIVDLRQHDFLTEAAFLMHLPQYKGYVTVDM